LLRNKDIKWQRNRKSLNRNVQLNLKYSNIIGAIYVVDLGLLYADLELVEFVFAG